MKSSYNAHFGSSICNNDFTLSFAETENDFFQDIFPIVYRYLDFTMDKNNFSLVCKKWSIISNDNTKIITVFRTFEDYQTLFAISQRFKYVEKVSISSNGKPILAWDLSYELSSNSCKHFKNLTYLYVWGKEITDDYIESFTNLKILWIRTDNIIPDESIKKLTNLTFLHLIDSDNISDKAIQNLTNLTSLTLTGNTSVTHEGIKNLTRLTSLRLDCSTGISNEGMKKLTNLTSLSFRYCELSHETILDKGISDEGIRNLTRLEYLDLTGNINISNSAIIKLTNLTELHLHDTSIGNDPGIGSLINLKTLTLSQNNVDLDLINLTNLTQLECYSNTEVTYNGISILTNLNTLILESDEYFDEYSDDFNLLTGLKKLTYLVADRLTDNVIIHLSNLQFLEFNGNGVITANGIISLTKLTHLSLSLPLLEDDWIPHLTNLTYLNIPTSELPRQTIVNIIYTLTNLKNLNKFKDLCNIPDEDLLPSESDGCSSPEIDDVDHFFSF